MLGRQPHYGTQYRGSSHLKKAAGADGVHPGRSQSMPSQVPVLNSMAAVSGVFNELPRCSVISTAVQKLSTSSQPDSALLDDRVQVLQRSHDNPDSLLGNQGNGWGDVQAHELQALVEQTLNPAAQVWQAKRAIQHGQRARRALIAADASLAYQVGELAKLHQFDDALRLINEVLRTAPETVGMISQRLFMASALEARQAAAALSFLHTLPKRFHDVRLYNMALQVCAGSRDYARALEVLELAEHNMCRRDVKLMTSMINVCRSIGNADRAFKFFADMKAERMVLDGRVYGALVAACAEAMQRELSVAHERKDQYVLLERAFNLMAEAEAAGIPLEVPVYNALLVCAGRSGQLGRAFEVLDCMTTRGVAPDVVTYGSLIEACVQANRQELALKIFYNALREGFTGHVEIYTMALSACKIEGHVNLLKALDVYTLMQRNGVEADKKFYAALMAVAGKASRLDLALENLEDIAADGMDLNSTLANALLYASQQDLGLMRKIYDFCSQQGVYPQVSQYNRMMDYYVSQSRFGEVVSLLCDMVKAGQVPNLNSYRILINACQRADQAQLAIEVYACMKAKRIPILQKKFAQSIFYSLLKVCFNQIRHQWSAQVGSKPVPWKGSGTPVVRMQEAEKLLAALRQAGPAAGVVVAKDRGSTASTSSSHHHQQQPGMGLMSLAPESINWHQHAIMAYRDLVATGFKPHITVVDMLMRSLRLKLNAQDFPLGPHSVLPQRGGPSHAGMPSYGVGSMVVGMPGKLGHMGGPPTGMHRQPWEVPSEQASPRGPAQRYETTFDRRALSFFEDAMNKGHVPSIKGVEEGPATVDLRTTPPCVAEVLVLAVLMAFEKRANKTGRCQVFHNVTFLVPTFNPDHAMWPSYVEKLNRQYSFPSDTPADDSQSSGDDDVAQDRLASTDSAEAAAEQRLLYNTDFEHDGASGESENGAVEISGRGFSGLPSMQPDAGSSRAGGMPLTAAEAARAMAAPQQNVGADEGQQYIASPATSLAVAATCRRMKIYTNVDPIRGIVVLGSQELSRWLINRRSYELQQQPSTSDMGSMGSGQDRDASAASGSPASHSPLAFRVAPSMMSMPEQSRRFTEAASMSADDSDGESRPRTQQHVRRTKKQQRQRTASNGHAGVDDMHVSGGSGVPK